jgi:hypothetical protein
MSLCKDNAFWSIANTDLLKGHVGAGSLSFRLLVTHGIEGSWVWQPRCNFLVPCRSIYWLPMVLRGVGCGILDAIFYLLIGKFALLMTLDFRLYKAHLNLTVVTLLTNPLTKTSLQVSF